MPPEPPDAPLVLLDACCVINLLASSVAEEVLATVPARFAAARIVVEDEVLFGSFSVAITRRGVTSATILGDLSQGTIEPDGTVHFRLTDAFRPDGQVQGSSIKST